MTKFTAARVNEYRSLYNQLKQVSHDALATATKPTPIIVGSPSTPLGNDVDPTKQTWYHADGLCGMAWVIVSGRSGFGRWLISEGLGSKNYTGGISIRDWSRLGFAETRQSYELKVQVARAMAKHLNDLGIDARIESRLD